MTLDRRGAAASVYEMPWSRKLAAPVAGFFGTVGAVFVATAAIPILARLSSIALIPFGVVLLVVGIRDLLDDSPVLIVSSSGLQNRSLGFMAWRDIASVAIRGNDIRLPGSLLSSSKRIEIDLHAQPDLRRQQARNLRRSGNPRRPSISQSSVYPYSIEDILADMRRHNPGLTVRTSV